MSKFFFKCWKSKSYQEKYLLKVIKHSNSQVLIKLIYIRI